MTLPYKSDVNDAQSASFTMTFFSQARDGVVELKEGYEWSSSSSSSMSSSSESSSLSSISSSSISSDSSSSQSSSSLSQVSTSSSIVTRSSSSSSFRECDTEWTQVAGHSNPAVDNFRVHGGNFCNTYYCKLFLEAYTEGDSDQSWYFHDTPERNNVVASIGTITTNPLPTFPKHYDFNPSQSDIQRIEFDWNGTAVNDSNIEIEAGGYASSSSDSSS